jgi:hypothetical protein
MIHLDQERITKHTVSFSDIEFEDRIPAEPTLRKINKTADTKSESKSVYGSVGDR